MSEPLLEVTDRGLYCRAGDFHVDPWRPVDRAVVTHGHSDHARPGCGRYLAADDGLGILRVRLGHNADLTGLAYGQSVDINGVAISLHPSGHILGSAQVRIERRGQVWVVSGDYKVEADRTCRPFEPVRCHVFITESTFGLPIYRWPDATTTSAEINDWWRKSAANGKTCVLFCYSLGKAQRLMANLDPSIGPIFEHGASVPLTQEYRLAGVDLPESRHAAVGMDRKHFRGAMVLAPSSAAGTPWIRKFAPYSTAFASGWMRIRGARRRRAVDRGFVVSDHADWPGLLASIAATGAERVWVTHGYSNVVVRHLRERGLDASVIPTRFEGDTPTEQSEPATDP